MPTATFLAPVGIGLALFIAQLWGTAYTGCGVNPARSLATSVVAASFTGSHWIYHLAPYTAALIAGGFYYLLRMSHFYTAVPGQDGDAVVLVMRDHTGHMTGFVQSVRQTEAPEIVQQVYEYGGTPALHTGDLGDVMSRDAAAHEPNPSSPQTAVGHDWPESAAGRRPQGGPVGF